MKKNDKTTQKQLEENILSLFINLTNGQAIVLKNYCESLATYEDFKSKKEKLDAVNLKNETTEKMFNQTTQNNESLQKEIVKLRAKHNNYGFLKNSDMKPFANFLKQFNTNLIKLQIALKQLEKKYKGPDKTR